MRKPPPPWIFGVMLLSILVALEAEDPPPTPSRSPQQPLPGLNELEAYKARLKQLQADEDDPARAARIRQMQALLTLMQRSLVLSEAKAEREASSPPPIPALPEASPAQSPAPARTTKVPEDDSASNATPPTQLAEPILADSRSTGKPAPEAPAIP